MRVRVRLLTLCAMLLLPHAGAAQQPQLAPGARIRVVTDTAWQRAVARYQWSDSLTLAFKQDGAPLVALPWRRVRALEVEAPPGSRGRSAERGLKIGALTGLALSAGVLVWAVLEEREQGCTEGDAICPVSGALVLTPYVVVPSALIGAGLGAVVHRRWRRVDLPSR